MSNYPDFNVCDDVDFGVSSRKNFDATAFSNSVGLKMADSIGFHLSTQRQHFSNNEIEYDIKGPYRKKMCGDMQYRAQAGQSRERNR